MSISIALRPGIETIIDRDDLNILRGGSAYLSSHGYAVINGECGAKQYLHRLIMKAKKGQIIDHKDRDKLNNRRSNLRISNSSTNQFNRGIASHNKSGFKGVYLCRQTGRFRCEIRFQKKVTKIGRFDTAEDAARAYDEAARRLHGEFAWLNFPATDETGNRVGRGCD